MSAPIIGGISVKNWPASNLQPDSRFLEFLSFGKTKSMKLLNVGCGGVRPPEPWINLDALHQHLAPGTPERTQLDSEKNYVDWHLFNHGWMPFDEEMFDGILCSHVIEHFDCHSAVRILTDCRRMLKPGGLLVVSVPDADYFLSVHDRDTPENAVELFGEPIHDKWQPTFMAYALLHREHLQLLTAGSLECLLLAAGFDQIWDFQERFPRTHLRIEDERCIEIEKVMNRRKFSLEMCAIKSSAS